MNTATKLNRVFAECPRGIPSSVLGLALTDEERSRAFQERWVVPDYENLGYYLKGAPSALATMEDATLAPTAKPMNPDELTVGDDIEVVDNGKAYKGKVQTVNPDGTYTSSFDGARPARDKFKRNELKKMTDKDGKPIVSPTAPVQRPSLIPSSSPRY